MCVFEGIKNVTAQHFSFWNEGRFPSLTFHEGCTVRSLRVARSHPFLKNELKNYIYKIYWTLFSKIEEIEGNGKQTGIFLNLKMNILGMIVFICNKEAFATFQIAFFFYFYSL